MKTDDEIFSEAIKSRKLDKCLKDIERFKEQFTANIELLEEYYSNSNYLKINNTMPHWFLMLVGQHDVQTDPEIKITSDYQPGQEYEYIINERYSSGTVKKQKVIASKIFTNDEEGVKWFQTYLEENYDEYDEDAFFLIRREAKHKDI